MRANAHKGQRAKSLRRIQSARSVEEAVGVVLCGWGAQSAQINTPLRRLPHWVGDIREQAAALNINKTLNWNKLSG